MTTQTEALKLALDALRMPSNYWNKTQFIKVKEAIAAAEEALAQPVSSHGTAEEALKRIAAYPFSRAEELSVEQMREIAREALAQPELCKYGQEPKSCTSSPMDCQCALDATFAQPEQEPDDLHIAYMYGLSRGKELAPQRKPLTDDEAFKLIEQDYQMEEYAQAALQLIRRTEAAHGIKE